MPQKHVLVMFDCSRMRCFSKSSRQQRRAWARPIGPAHWAQPNWAHWAYWAHLGQFGFACVYACCFVVYVWVLVCICVYMCVFIVRMRVYLCVFTICLCICLNQISLGAHGRSTNKVAKCELRRRCSSCTILQKTTNAEANAINTMQQTTTKREQKQCNNACNN